MTLVGSDEGSEFNVAGSSVEFGVPGVIDDDGVSGAPPQNNNLVFHDANLD